MVRSIREVTMDIRIIHAVGCHPHSVMLPHSQLHGGVNRGLHKARVTRISQAAWQGTRRQGASHQAVR